MNSARIPSLDPSRVAIIEQFGARIEPIEPLGAAVHGMGLTTGAEPPAEVLAALEVEMAHRGFIVFRCKQPLEPQDFLRVSCWWGGRELHSTHGVHPATPDGNTHIFRLSNDPQHGIPGVGPQWHNDGSFNPTTFSHSGYHIVRPAENGGGTFFAHQSAAFDALDADRQEYWSRLASVNSNSGVVHPVVHTHPLTNRQCVWLHLGMTGAVLEKVPKQGGFRLLEADELTQLCHEYNALLNAGLKNGYAIAYEYQQDDCLFIDNLAVAHKAAPEAHKPANEQGLRIMHRSTVRGVDVLQPRHDLPLHVDIHGPNPAGTGVWHGGAVGFRWEQGIPMRN